MKKLMMIAMCLMVLVGTALSAGLSVYPPVPGLDSSPHYQFRVRQVGTEEWKEPFAWFTKCIDSNPENDATKYYSQFIGGWSHTYCNFEMGEGVLVEVEISRLDPQTGAPVEILKATPHPRRKVRSWRVENGRVYITIDQPALFAVDIDGQMDDNKAPRATLDISNPLGYPSFPFRNENAIHTVSVFANPFINDKPDLNDPNVYAVNPGEIPPETGDWTTLYFKPGVHKLFEGDRLDAYYPGFDFQLHSNKSYYIPGDAIIYGHMNTFDNANNWVWTRNVRVFGHGTLSGAKSLHPEDMEVPYSHIDTDEGRRFRSLELLQATGSIVEGITFADAANHTMKMNTRGHADPAEKPFNYARWLKVITWRSNGDGITILGNGYLEDSFIRTQDDGSYVRGLGIRRMVYWNDVNGAALRNTFIMNDRRANFPSTLPDKLYVEDIDIIYGRGTYHHDNSRQSVIQKQDFRQQDGNTGSHVVFRNINYEDPMPSRSLFGFDTRVDRGTSVGDVRGVRFENVRAAAPGVFGRPNTFWGTPDNEITDMIFDNVVLAGRQFKSIDDFVHNAHAFNFVFENTDPQTMTYLNTSGYGKWYIHDDWTSGVEPADHDIVNHTSVADTLIVDAPAYAGTLNVSHAEVAVVRIENGGSLAVADKVSLGSAGGVGQIRLVDGTLEIQNSESSALSFNRGYVHLEKGTLRWAGNQIDRIQELYDSGAFTLGRGQLDGHSETATLIAREGHSTLYAEFDESSGYTTVWLAEAAAESGHDIRVGIGALQGRNPNFPEYVRFLQIPVNRHSLQWATVEKEQGVYDFSFIEESLKEIKALNRNAIIKLNANRKPDWLFDIVPYHPEELGGAVDDPLGTLMYWHPTFVEAYENLLIAFGKYLEQSEYRDIITGIRMSFNAIGTEHTYVSPEHRPLNNWIIPEGVDNDIPLEEWTPEIATEYRKAVVGFHIDHILPYAFVWARQGLPDELIEYYRSYFETGKLGFFQTGASMEQNQIYNQTSRYSRFIEFSRTGKTNAFTEVDGYQNYTGRYINDLGYSEDEIFQMTQFNYWRMLSEMHAGVSMAGVHMHMFRGQLEEDGPVLDFFEVPDMDAGWRFADKYIGLHASPKESPGAWVALRDDTGDNYQGDYTFLMEREGNNPIWPLVDNYPGVNDGSVGKRKVGSDLVRFGAWARGLPSGTTMTFHVDPRVFYPGEKRIARVVYFDEGLGIWELRQGGHVKMTVTNEDTGEWIEKEVLIITDGDQYEIVNIGTDEVIFHMLEVKRDSSPWPGQSPYEGTNHTLPGLIEAEHYDEGGQGVAYFDTTEKQGDLSFRPEDDVDVVAREGASNGYVVSYTSEGEWLEYTVDVKAGNYDITLYYYCGATPGDLLVSLNYVLIATISGMQNQGWDKLDSITVENVFLPAHATDNILRLEFANGAGFDIDAIKFKKQYTPVSSVTMAGCPGDDLFVGNTLQLTAIVAPYNADDKTVSWESSDDSVLTVDSSGMVTAISEGAATITVISNDGGFTDACEVNTKIEIISVYGLTIGGCPPRIIRTGDTHQLIANVAPENATDRSVIWSSSNTQVATVDSTGMVTAKSQGSVRITAITNDGGFTRTCTIGIMSTGVPVTGVTLSGCPTGNLEIDSTYQLIAQVAPTDAGDLRVSWSSSDETVATVDENGWITTLSAGETKITATTIDGGFTDECTLMVGLVISTNEIMNKSNGIKVYPNPVQDKLFLEFPGSGLQRRIAVYNALGQLLLSEKTNNNHIELNVSNFLQYSILIVEVIFGETAEYFKVITNI